MLSPEYNIYYTDVTNIFTKYGMFQAKMYTHKQQEYLVIINQNISKGQIPLFYIHPNTHECDALDTFCDCHYPIGVALQLLKKSGGYILYSSYDIKDIDTLLQEMHASKLQVHNSIHKGTNLKSALKGYRGEYLVIDFILKDLKLTKLQLVSDNPNILYIMLEREIQILTQNPSLSFSYGDSQLNKTNQTQELLNAITFKYPNSNK